MERFPNCPAFGQRVSLAAMLLLSMLPGARSADMPAPLTSARQIHGLADAEASKGLPVRVEGTVLQRWRGRQMIFVDSGDFVLEVLAPGTNALAASGQAVALEGFTIGQAGVQIVANDVRELETRDAPPVAPLVPVRDLERTKLPRWVRVDGVIRQLKWSPERLWLELRDRGQLLQINIPRPGEIDEAVWRFARVQVTGVLTTWQRMGVNGQGPVLWADGLDAVEIAQPHAANPYDFRKALDIRKVLEIKPELVWSFRPRVSGTVVRLAEDGIGFRMADKTGEIFVSALAKEPLRIGDSVDVVGFIEPDPTERFMGWSEVRIRDFPGLPQEVPERITVLTRAEDVRLLSREYVRARPPVRLSGVVTYANASENLIFLNDETAGIQVEVNEFPVGLAGGVRVQMEGYAEPGLTAPRVVATRLESREAEGFPGAAEVQANGLLAGRYEGSWVRLEGIVRSAAMEGAELQMRLSLYGPVFPVVVAPGSVFPATNIVDGRVELFGVAQAIVNRNGQITGCRVLVPDYRLVRNLDPAPEDPFVVRRTKIGSFMSFDPLQNFLRMRSVEGVVTLSWPGQLFVEDDTGSVEVRIPGDAQVRAGDIVQVAGFSVLGAERPVLEDAQVRFHGRDELPPAQGTYAERILTQELNGRRATITGTLLSKTIGVREYTLMLEDGDVTVPVVLRRRVGPVDLEPMEVGCQLQVTGICDLYGSNGQRSRDVRLLVDSARHLIVVAPPPFWNERRLLMAGVVMALLIALLLLRQMFLARRIAFSQSRFAAAFKASPVPVAIVSRGEHRVLDVNDSFESHFEFQRRQLIHCTLTELGILRDRPLMERVEQTLADGRPVRALDCRLYSRSGVERQILLSVEPIEIDGEACLLFIFQDVTERLALMNQLRDSQKLEAVGQLAAGVAHDFNNLLTIIRGNCDILGELAEDDSELKEVGDEIGAAANRAAELTRQLLAFSRKQRMVPRIVDLNVVVEDAMKMLRRLLGSDIEVRADLAGGEVAVFADVGMLDQILVNLAVNSRDAMPDGGQVTFSTATRRIAELDGALHSDSREGDYVVLAVADDGSGIAGHELKRIFEPFFTTKELGKGTGLGLATVHGIVKQHRGWIDVESTVGEGTKFSIFLPLAESRVAVAEEKLPLTGSRTGSETVLLAEDEPAVRRMICRTLERAGYTVVVAEDGLKARAAWRRQKGAIDLLLTDIVMPGGVSGHQLARQLRADRHDLRIVYISGFDPASGPDGEAAEAGLFLAKPFTNHDLLATVRMALDETSLAG